jgi:two-component system chemotaxis sensor kinase CheA
MNDAMLDVFLFETSQLMEQLEELILSNEKEDCCSETTINEIFRIMHTIKGSSAMMMFENISKLAHAMEDLFYYIREEKPKNVDFSVTTDLILECMDFIKVELEKIKNGDQPDGEYFSLMGQINELLEGLKQGKGVVPVAIKTEAEPEPDEAEEKFYIPGKDAGKEVGQHWFKAEIYFDSECEMEDMRAFSVIHQMEEITKEMFYLPEDTLENSQSSEVIRKEGFHLYLKTDRSFEEMLQDLEKTPFLKKLDFVQLEDDKELRQLFGKTEQAQTPEPSKELDKIQPGKETPSTPTQQSIISVSVTKLDALMDLVGEMVIAEAMVIQNSDLNGLVLDNFYKSARQLNKITNEIQDVVMSIRMVPLSATFHKMHRIVRDMCKKLGKDVELEIIGEETEVDKNIIEHISDPLMHLVRNSLDHGIESPQDRLTLGKDEKGTITLEAKNAGGDVLIIIKDDGKGIDKKTVLDKAEEHGLLTKPREEMLDKEIFNLIFLPGFSTKEKVSEFSGRGVGMDVVTKNIEMIGGSIGMESTFGKGTTITLKLPLTLAIIDGMNIKVGNAHYTIPTISIKEFFRPEERNIIKDTDDHEMIMVRGECYPIIRLHRVYRIRNAKTAFEEGIIIMVEQDDRTVCIFADELLGQQQVVVKALPEYISRIKKIEGLTGCTLLGDGNISLIIDVAGLISN